MHVNIIFCHADLQKFTLKDERLKQDKSIRTLAYEYDLQMSLISRPENGINEPQIISLWSVCEALGISVSELMKRVEQQLPDGFSIIER